MQKLENKVGSTPLHLAASRGHKDIVSLLLRCGADIDCVDGEGATPTTVARRNGMRECEEILCAWPDPVASTIFVNDDNISSHAEPDSPAPTTSESLKSPFASLPGTPITSPKIYPVPPHPYYAHNQNVSDELPQSSSAGGILFPQEGLKLSYTLTNGRNEEPQTKGLEVNKNQDLPSPVGAVSSGVSLPEQKDTQIFDNHTAPIQPHVKSLANNLWSSFKNLRPSGDSPVTNWPTKLYNFSKRDHKTLTREESTNGSMHAQVHTVTYLVNGIPYGKADAASVSIARMRAAEMAYKALTNDINGF
ncbi:hypothetical protein DL96DRAFT_1717213 [Flagelloscypha sp. PMI_526]|nr:hypothetical protein DL96DRAFT_1717213 [Flagelloscypha sp. PMI_526]